MLCDIYFLSGNIFVVFHLPLPSKKKKKSWLSCNSLEIAYSQALWQLLAGFTFSDIAESSTSFLPLFNKKFREIA